jgi:RimJ/RimL family protein N-acetyltransferase
VTEYESHDSFFDAVLTGQRLTLRPYVEERDGDFLSKLPCNPEVTAPMGIPAPRYNPDDIRDSKRRRLESNDSGDWSIFVRDGEILIGEIGIGSHDDENHVYEIFIAIDPEHNGKGYAMEATSLLMDHILATSPVATIRVRTMSTNARAIKLALKLGFRESGSSYIAPDESRGFVGGMYISMDYRKYVHL